MEKLYTKRETELIQIIKYCSDLNKINLFWKNETTLVCKRFTITYIII